MNDSGNPGASIDWQALATQLGTISRTAGGWNELGGTDLARQALCEIVGHEQWIAAVDFYLTSQPGHELALSVLRLLGPPSAMQHCHVVFLDSGDSETRANAVYLLSQICDRRAFEWVPAYLSDEDPGVRVWALRILDELLIIRGEIEEAEAQPFIDAALADPDERVRNAAHRFIELIEHERTVSQESKADE